MKQKKIVIAIIMCLLIVALGIVVALIISKNNTKLDDNYYAKLCSGTGEQIECTYLYNLNNNYSYVSTKENTESWGSSKWEIKVVDKGNLERPQSIFEIVREKGTDGYVVLNVDVKENMYQKGYSKGDVLTLEEFNYLISLEDKFDAKDKNELFTIYSTKLNCNTPRLKVYDDNSYSYHRYVFVGDDSNFVIVGNYDYDISKIFENINSYNPTGEVNYILTDSDNNSYQIYEGNKEINEFLDSIYIGLNECASVMDQ